MIAPLSLRNSRWVISRCITRIVARVPRSVHPGAAGKPRVSRISHVCRTRPLAPAGAGGDSIASILGAGGGGNGAAAETAGSITRLPVTLLAEAVAGAVATAPRVAAVATVAARAATARPAEPAGLSSSPTLPSRLTRPPRVACCKKPLRRLGADGASSALALEEAEVSRRAVPVERIARTGRRCRSRRCRSRRRELAGCQVDAVWRGGYALVLTTRFRKRGSGVDLIERHRRTDRREFDRADSLNRERRLPYAVRVSNIRGRRASFRFDEHELRDTERVPVPEELLVPLSAGVRGREHLDDQEWRADEKRGPSRNERHRMQYFVIYESGDDGGWSAYAPDLPGLGVSGDSLDEVRELIRKAIAFHVAGLRDGGLPVPKPSAKAGEFIEISTA
jgi:predicted RNase H-like HicB family nuclease